MNVNIIDSLLIYFPCPYYFYYGLNILSQRIPACVCCCWSQLGQVMSEMSTIYSTATVCLKDGQDCQTLEPGGPAFSTT